MRKEVQLGTEIKAVWIKCYARGADGNWQRGEGEVLEAMLFNIA